MRHLYAFTSPASCARSGSCFDRYTSASSPWSRALPSAATVIRLALLLLVVGALPLQARLVFETTRVELAGKFGEEQLVATYPFENKGERAVTVTEIKSGCGCTVPELEQKVYAPGERGELRAIFTVGQRQGEQRQIITVKTDAGEQALRLIVALPQRVEITPRILLFRGADSGAKEAQLHFAEDLPVTIENLIVSDPTAFSVSHEWQEVKAPAAEEGRVAQAQDCRVSVRYLGSAGSEARALIQIQTKGKSGKVYTDYLHLRHIP